MNEQRSSQNKLTTAAERPARPMHARSRWQFLVVSSATSTNAKLNGVRADSAHALQSPHFPLAWTQQVGWHNPVNFPIANAPAVEALIAPPKFLATATPAAPQSNKAAAEMPNVELRVAELATQLANDIQAPLAAAFQVVASISQHARSNSFLSMHDADKLIGVSNQLEMISKWAESILLNRRPQSSSYEVIHSRFMPSAWKDSIQESLAAIARSKQIQLNWVGWDAQLPFLYLDANHLSRAILNVVASSVAASEPLSQITIRVNWQNNVTQRLMITIEDNGQSLPTELLKTLNGSSDASLQPAQSVGLQTARVLTNRIGGIIAGQHGTHGGNIVRISLPVDTYASVIRAWILQNATLAVDEDDYHVSVFSVRSSSNQADAFNVHLQKAASIRQYVYRTAANRWLMLEMKSSSERDDSSLMAAAEKNIPIELQDSQPWLSQSVFASEAFKLHGLLGRSDTGLRLPQLTTQLAHKFEELLHQHSPILDKLVHSASALPSPHFKPPMSPVAALSQSTNPPANPQPGASTVQEIIRQWKSVQAKLARLEKHPALSR